MNREMSAAPGVEGLDLEAIRHSWMPPGDLKFDRNSSNPSIAAVGTICALLAEVERLRVLLEEAR